jgi:UDPglucose 6-dehydrogenase
VTLVEDEYAAVEHASAVVLMTEWPEFRLPDWDQIKPRMASPVVFDGRNIYSPDVLTSRGYTYYGIGR